MTTIADLKSRISILSREEVLVASNEGTFSAIESQRAVGTGDTKAATVKVYESVSGETRWVGPRADVAPGRIRNFSSAKASLTPKREELRKLKSDLAAAEAKIRGNARGEW